MIFKRPYKMLKLFAAVLFFFSISAYVEGGSNPSCPPNQQYLGCRRCDQICGGPPTSCTAQCVAGCSCLDGYVISNAPYPSGCISQKECDRRLGYGPKKPKHDKCH